MNTNERLFLRTLGFCIALSVLVWSMLAIEHAWKPWVPMADPYRVPTPPYMSVGTFHSKLLQLHATNWLKSAEHELIVFWRFGA